MLKTIFSLPADLYRNRRLVMKLAKNDFKTRYAGSYFGTIWAFVQPVVTILVYWFVFSVGFRSNTDELGIPFVLYLVAGIVPWFFFSDYFSIVCAWLFCYISHYSLYEQRQIPRYVLFTDFLLQCMCLLSGNGAVLCNQRDCSAVS